MSDQKDTRSRIILRPILQELAELSGKSTADMSRSASVTECVPAREGRKSESCDSGLGEDGKRGGIRKWTLSREMLEEKLRKYLELDVGQSSAPAKILPAKIDASASKECPKPVSLNVLASEFVPAAMREASMPTEERDIERKTPVEVSMPAEKLETEEHGIGQNLRQLREHKFMLTTERKTVVEVSMPTEDRESEKDEIGTKLRQLRDFVRQHNGKK